MRTQTIDRILLGAALIAAVASCAWFCWPASGPGKGRRAVTAGAKFAAATETPEDPDRVAVMPEHWLPPAPQSRGPRWVYDLFTPPEIFYEAQTGKFDVIPPNDPAKVEAPAAPPGLQLLAVKRDFFRLQLIGYVGRDGGSLGTFENVATGEVFLAGPGRQMPALGLEITEFTVQRRPARGADGTTLNQRVALAVVRDTRTGRITTLTADERTYTDELCAILADEDGDETTREVRNGEEIQNSDHTYKVERLQLDPPAVEFSQVASASTQVVRLSLSARTAGDPPTAAPTD